MQIATIDRTFLHARTRRRCVGVVALVGVVLCFLVSAWVSEFSLSRLAEGLPRAGAYFAKLLPDLRWESLFAGLKKEGSLAIWIYRLYDWARRLF